MSTFLNFHQFHKNIFASGYKTSLNSGKLLKFNILKSIKLNKHDLYSTESTELLLTSGTIKLSYEALTPLFALSGHEHRLMLFIVAYCANKEDNCFKWNNILVEEYMELYKITSGKQVKPESVRQALEKLKKINVLRMLAKGEYMLNPLYSARPSKFEAQHLFSNFLKKALLSGKTLLNALYMNK